MHAGPRAASVWLSEVAERQADSRQRLTTAHRAVQPARSMEGLSHLENRRQMDRIVHKADFECTLAARSCSRSLHFTLHFAAGAPVSRVWQPKAVTDTELSTGPAPSCPQAVDELSSRPDTSLWFGCVVPKRHARRAVTRNLLKRQVRSAFECWGSNLAPGRWLVRLRLPFDKREFVSARSGLLVAAARTELEALLSRAVA